MLYLSQLSSLVININAKKKPQENAFVGESGHICLFGHTIVHYKNARRNRVRDLTQVSEILTKRLFYICILNLL